MKLLIVTQKVDQHDTNLGFFHEWIKTFASECEQVTVICLYKGQYSLPENVHILSLGKEEGTSRIKYIFRFYKYIWNERKSYDAVFVHMNPIYLVLGGMCWRMMGKKISLWYLHKSVDLKLRIAAFFTHIIFTASKESFRLESPKVKIVGHGIDTDKFSPLPQSHEGYRALSAGRISKIKNYEYIIDAVDILKKEGKDISLDIIGKPLTEDDTLYFKTLEKKKSDGIIFKGALPNSDMPACLRKADVFINMSDTGSMDKAILEAMAVGIPVISSNVAFKTLLEPYGLFIPKRLDALVNTIRMLYDKPTQAHDTGKALRDIVVRDHNLNNLITRIVTELHYETSR